MGERNGAFAALCLLLVGEVASENLAICAWNILSSVAQKIAQVRRGIFWATGLICIIPSTLLLWQP